MLRDGLSLSMKTRIFVSASVLLSTVMILGMIIVLNQASPRSHWPSDQETEKLQGLEGGEFTVYSALLEFMKTSDPNTNQIPACMRGKELEFASRLPQKDDLSELQSWTSAGPSNFTGRILSLAIDADNENIMMATAASGGVWRTEDAGASWIKTTAPSAIPSATCIVQDLRPGKRNNWYYGTGELLSTTDRRLSIISRTVFLGDGIFKSQDGGLSWNQIPSTKTSSPGTLCEVFQGIWNIVIDTSNHAQDELYAACYGGIMRSVDGGDHWTFVLGHLTFKPFSTDIAIGPQGILYAGLSTYCAEYPGNPCPIGGIWTSTDGIQWQNITPADFPEDYRRIRLAIAPSDPDILYVFTEEPIMDPDPTFGFTASQHYFWKYTFNKKNGRGLWEDRTINLPGKGRGNIISGYLDTIHGAFNSIGGYAFTLMVHPDNSDYVFIGGTNLYRNTTGFADSNYSHWLGGYPYDYADTNLHPDQHYMLASLSQPNVMFVANDGGIYKTTDCFAPHVKWDIISLGIINSQVYWVGMDHVSLHDDFAIAGIQDNAIFITDKNLYPLSDWEVVCGGDGLTSIIADHKAYMLGSVYAGNIFSFQVDSLNNLINMIFQRPVFLSDSNFIFYTNYALDPNDNTTFYFPQKNHLWRKSNMADAASDTNQVNTGWTELTNVALGYQDFIIAITVSKIPANRVYFGTYSGKVFRLDEANTGNPVPVEITGSSFPIYGFISCIEADPDNADNCFVVFSNYKVQSIFYSDDGGYTWEAVSGNLEENPDGSGNGPSVRWVKILNYQGTTIYYAGTSVGLFSANGLSGKQTVWYQESPGMIGRSIVDMIDARSTDGWVLVATQGNGIYSSYFNPAGIWDQQAVNPPLLDQNYPNPATTETKIKFTIPVNERIQIILYDQEGRQIKPLLDQKVQKGTHTITVPTDNFTDGIYYYHLISSAGSSSRKMVVHH